MSFLSIASRKTDGKWVCGLRIISKKQRELEFDRSARARRIINLRLCLD
jgi:hypothetical protein